MPAPSRARHPRLSVESLETRAVPATLVNPRTVTYTDFDGDLVTVAFSKPVLTAANVDTVFRFDNRGVDGDNSTPQQLQTIELLSPGADGTSVRVSARPTQSSGDGRVNVGAIDATGSDLGTVVIPGDLGRMLAGDTLLVDGPGLKSLLVNSMGRFGTTTQGGGDLISRVRGSIGGIRVVSDVVDADWMQGGESTKVGPVSIGGDCSGWFSLEGPATDVVVGGDLTGALFIDLGSGRLSIGGSVRGGIVSLDATGGEVRVGGSLVGGDSEDSGQIYVSGPLARLSIGQNIVGGAGDESGVAEVSGPIQSAFVGGDVVGGAGLGSGQLTLWGRAGSVRVRGGVIGGTGSSSGYVYTAEGGGSVAVGGDVVGSTGAESGAVLSGPRLGSIRIGGDVRGGTGRASGSVFLESVRRLVVTGDVLGGAGNSSGVLQAYSGRTVDVQGSIRGGTAPASGMLDVVGSLTAVHVGGDVEGGTATADGQDLERAGSVSVGRVGRLTIDGSVVGGSSGGFANARLAGTGQVSLADRAETVLIRGSLVGRDQRARLLARGAEDDFGFPAGEAFGSLTVLGRVERADILGGYVATEVTPVLATGLNVKLGRIVVAGDWIASNLTAGVNIQTGELIEPAVPEWRARIRSIEIAGQVIGTAADGDSYLFAAQVIGQLKVGGDTLVPTTPGAGNDLVTGLGPFGDVMLKEFPVT
jgi:hypothetical protein